MSRVFRGIVAGTKPATMARAAELARCYAASNILTSVGAAATQSIG